jgi:hypothetical protein
MSFAALMQEFETLAKSMAEQGDTDDARIHAAAGGEGGEGGEAGSAEGNGEGAGEAGNGAAGDGNGEGAAGGAAGGDGDADDKGGAGDGDADDKGGETLGKSFSATTEDGETKEFIDGTELVKSLMSRIETNESESVAVMGQLGDLIKSQSQMLQSQGQLIKSLQEQVSSLGSEGRGRKATVSLVQKPSQEQMAKSQAGSEEMTGPQFLAKCLQAQAAGRLTGMDVSRAQIALNSGVNVPADIVSRVAG